MEWVNQAISNIMRQKIAHRNWCHALARAFAMMNACAPGEVIYITGPSRAGKSRLIKELSRIMKNPEHDDMYMPCFTVMAANCSTRGSFSTKAFTIRSLEAIKHPIYGTELGNDDWSVERLRLLEKTSEGVLRLALESAIINRRCKYMFIDEAQHLMYATRGMHSAAAILDSWKCLAQSVGIILILVGAYPLLNVLKQSPHLLGRKHEVHIPRYRETRDDILAFKEIIEFYDRIIHDHFGQSNFRDWDEYLFHGSFGCIGLLQSWLRAALAIADATEAERLTKEHLMEAKLSPSDSRIIEEEILEGEAIMNKAEEESANNSIRKVYKSARPGKKGKKRRKKPFQKNPRRYPVGGRR